MTASATAPAASAIGQVTGHGEPPVRTHVELLAELVEPALVPSDEREASAIARKALGDDSAKRAGGARDEDDRVVRAQATSDSARDRGVGLDRCLAGGVVDGQLERLGLFEVTVVDEVAALVGLRLEVGPVVCVRRDHQRDPIGDLDSERTKPVDLARVVRHQAHGTDTERAQHVRRDRVVALVVAEAEGDVRLDRVEAVVLQLVRPDLVGQPDPAALLPQVEQDPVGHPRESAQRCLELVPAIAPERPDGVAGQALGVDPHRDGLAVERLLTVHEGSVLLGIEPVLEPDDVVVAEAGRKPGGGHDPDADPLAADARAHARAGARPARRNLGWPSTDSMTPRL